MTSRENSSIPLAIQVPAEATALEEITSSYLSCVTPAASADLTISCDKNPVSSFKG